MGQVLSEEHTLVEWQPGHATPTEALLTQGGFCASAPKREYDFTTACSSSYHLSSVAWGKARGLDRVGEDLPAAFFSVVAIKLGDFVTMAGGDWAGDRWTDHYLPGYKEVSSTPSDVVGRDGERWLPR